MPVVIAAVGLLFIVAGCATAFIPGQLAAAGAAFFAGMVLIALGEIASSVAKLARK